MNITKAVVTRKFNLGNYEQLCMTAEAELTNDNLKEALTVLRDNIEMCFTDMERKDKPTPPVQAKMPYQAANDNTVKRQQAATADPTKCPKCGATKKPQFELCYRCHEDDKAN